MQLLNIYGLRNDGRKPEELRKIRCEIGLNKQANGSAYYQMGNTKILATVYGPHQIFSKQPISNESVIINCQISCASFSNNSKPKKGKSNQSHFEITQILQKSLESVIMVHLLPKCQIDIFIEILQMDGSVLSSCVNASTLALADAGIPMSHMLVSCTLGISCASNISTGQQKFQCSLEIPEHYTENMEGNIFLIDLNGSEDSGMVSGNVRNNNNLPGMCLIAKVKQSSETDSTNTLSCELVALEIYHRIPFQVIEAAQQSANLACQKIYTLLNESCKYNYVVNYPEKFAT